MKKPKHKKFWISQEEVLEIHKKLKENIESSLSKKRKIDKQTFKNY